MPPESSAQNYPLARRKTRRKEVQTEVDLPDFCPIHHYAKDLDMFGDKSVIEKLTPQHEQLQPPLQLPEQQSLQSQPAIIYGM